MPECKEGCPFDINPEIALIELEGNEACAGLPGSDYMGVSGIVQLTGITWQSVRVEYNQLNGAPVPGGYFSFNNLPNNNGIVTITSNSSGKGKEFSPPSKPLTAIDWYPNPTNDILNIYNRSAQEVIATISNLQGQRMITDQVEAHQRVQLSSTQWPAGLYILDIRDRYSGKLLRKEKIVIIH